MQGQIFFLKELVKRDFQSRFAGSLLGVLWPFVQPLFQLALFTFVFSVVMKISLVGERTDSFGIFLFAGLLPWMAVQEGVSRSATAVTDNSNMVRSSSFRAEVLVLATVLGGLVQEAIAGAVFIVILALLGKLSLLSLPVLLLVLPLQIALTLGLGLLVCSLHTLFRDVAQLVNLLMMGWFYVTPIVYSMNLVPPSLRPWLAWNPLTTVVELYRQALLGGGFAGFAPILRLALTAALLLLLGGWVFRRLADGFVDHV